MRQKAKPKPQRYRKEYAARLIAYGCEGKSLQSFCASVGLSREDIERFAEKHKAFAEAMRLHWGGRLAFWEMRAMAIAQGKACDRTECEVYAALKGEEYD
jgi:hypothetical protein